MIKQAEPISLSSKQRLKLFEIKVAAGYCGILVYCVSAWLCVIGEQTKALQVGHAEGDQSAFY